MPSWLPDTLLAVQDIPARSASSLLFGALLAVRRLLLRCPSGEYIHSAYLLLVTRWLGGISEVASRLIPNCSVPSWIFGTLRDVRRPPDLWGTSYWYFFLGDCMGAANPKDRVYPGSSYARCVTARNTLSDSPIVPVRSPSLTDCASSPKKAQIDQEVVEQPGEHTVAMRMAL